MKRKMRKIIYMLCIAAAFLSAASRSKAEILIPQPADEYINDFAGVITATDKASISSMLRQVSEKVSARISVVTVNSVEEYAPGMDPEAFAVTIFSAWKLEEKTGKAMLIFVSIRDRQITMELGSAKPGLYDVLMQKVVKTRMVPNFKEGDYGRGIYEGVRMLSEILTKQTGFMDIINKYFIVIVAVLGLIIIIIIAAFVPKKSNKPGKAIRENKSEKTQSSQKKETQDIFGGGAAGSW